MTQPTYTRNIDISLQCRQKKTEEDTRRLTREVSGAPGFSRVLQVSRDACLSRTHLCFADIRNHYIICLKPKLN